ncbi:MAG: hypothetical protein NC397_05470 [Clostridium sp.]|nr:hypothetical protein [Clostridium sp.]
MKKIITAFLILTLCLSFAACAKQDKEPLTMPPSTEVTDPVESTTKAPHADKEKGKHLKSVVLKTLGSKKEASIEGDIEYGKFTYKYNRDPQVVYANEESEALMSKAADNADALVDQLFVIFDCEINKYNTITNTIGNGDNGIDSVQYQFFYKNTQNQILKIYADSDGVISYVDCSFTW